MRFYVIAFASLREIQALIEMEDSLKVLYGLADQLGANLYRLTRARPETETEKLFN